MRKHFVTLSLLAGLLAGPFATARAADPIRLHVYTAIEVEYDTQPGKSYTLQGSANLADWTDIGPATPGTGRPVNRIFSTKGGGTVNFNNYRLSVSDGPTNGFAPWSLAGLSLEFDDEPGGDVMNFTGETNGVDVSEGDNDLFNYLYGRLGENEARAEITYASNRSETVTFEFTGPGVGTWSRDEFRNGKLKDHDAGPFRIVGLAPPPAGTNPPIVNPNVVVAPPVLPPAPPASLSNLVYYFQASGIPDRYEFLDQSNGREVQGVVQEGLPTNSFVYTYTVLGSNTAFLRLSFGYYGMGGDRYDCDLTFTDGASGHFVRRLYRRGVLKDTDEGAFSQNDQFATHVAGTPPPPPGTNAATFPPTIVPTAPPAPPASLLGKTYFVFTTPAPDQYQFSGANYGYATPGISQSEEIETSPGGNLYTYGYSVLSSNTASLVITYGYYNLGGDREEYDLTFVDGATATFVRRLYRLGNLHTNQTGIFSTNAVLPYGSNNGSGGAGNPPANTNPPPANLSGLTVVMNTGEQLAFQTATTGVQADNSAPTDFNFTYTATGANTFTLHVQFKPDKWDDYELTFTDGAHGSFVRQQYANSELKDTDADTFYVVPTTP